jgi:putative PIN family toxin of toxin-antitoxin system
MRVILDTAVMIAAIRSDAGASRQLLVGALTEQYTLLLSVPLLIEYEAVMTRPEHLRVSGLSAGEVEALLDAIVSVAEPVRLAFLWRPMLRDPDDDMVLEAAVNGQANLLVTFNHRDFENASGRFEVEVVSPGEAVRAIQSRRER